MRTIVMRLVTLCFLCLVFASPVQAASIPVVAAIQKRYAGLTTMNAAYTQVLTHKQNGRVEKREGLFYFETPLKIRWETQKPVPELQLVTPEAIWNIFPDEDMAFRYAPEPPKGLRDLIALLTGQSHLADEFDIEPQGVTNGLLTLLLYPKGSSAESMTSAELRVDPKSGEIHFVGIVDLFHNRNDITFVSQSLGIPLAATLFTFTPPKGMKVEDKTTSGVTGSPLAQ